MKVKLTTCPERMSRVMHFLLTNLNKTDRNCHPLQVGCPNILPGLRTQPFWETSEFPWVKALEAASQTIREEFQEMKDKGRFFQVTSLIYDEESKSLLPLLTAISIAKI
jgi:hypothetical protein